MRAPRIRRLRQLDYPTTDPALLDAINSILDDLQQPDSDEWCIRPLLVTPATSYPLTYLTGLSRPTRGLTVVGALDTDNIALPFASAPFVSWMPSPVASGQVIIQGVSGLTAGHSYRLTIEARG